MYELRWDPESVKKKVKKVLKKLRSDPKAQKDAEDTAEEAAYQEALKSNEEAFAKHPWIPDPKGLARKATDVEFGRIDTSKLKTIDVDKYRI